MYTDERDAAAAQPPLAAGEDPRDHLGHAFDTTPVGAIMRRHVPRVPPHTHVEAVRSYFDEFDEADLDTPCVAVVDEQGQLQGVVRRAEAMAGTARRGAVASGRGPGAGGDGEPAASTAGALASPSFVSLPPEATLEIAVALMAYEGTSWIPVVDDERRLLGMVLAADVMRWLAAKRGFVVPPRGH